MRRPFLAAAATALSLVSTTAAAQPADPNHDDLRCLLVTAMIMESPQGQAVGLMAAMYFVGKIQGRSPTYDIEAGVLRLLTDLKNLDIAVEGQRCGKELQAVGDRYKGMGERLKASAGKART